MFGLDKFPGRIFIFAKTVRKSVFELFKIDLFFFLGGVLPNPNVRDPEPPAQVQQSSVSEMKYSTQLG